MKITKMITMGVNSRIQRNQKIIWLWPSYELSFWILGFTNSPFIWFSRFSWKWPNRPAIIICGQKILKIIYENPGIRLSYHFCHFPSKFIGLKMNFLISRNSTYLYGESSPDWSTDWRAGTIFSAEKNENATIEADISPIHSRGNR